MKLHRKDIPKTEIVHFHEHDTLITSYFNCVRYDFGGKRGSFKLPVAWYWRLFGVSRLIRRALRLDKMNVAVSRNKQNLVCLYQGRVFHYDVLKKTLSYRFKLGNCRNVLHQSILSFNGDGFCFGEYGANKERSTVNIYTSLDGGSSWAVVYTFKPGEIKHIHGCYFDPYTQKVWTLTGDFSGECYMLLSDVDFKDVQRLGDGSQVWRAVSLFFTERYVYWIMDSQLETSYLIRYCRETGSICKLWDFPGPVWYIKALSDGYYLAATAKEVGPGVKSACAHIYISRDLECWYELARFQHDGWPMRYFKFGVIAFSDGEQSSQNFSLFGEALKGLDGKAFFCSYQGGV